MHSSPVTPRGTMRPMSSTIFTSTCGWIRPTVLTRRSSGSSQLRLEAHRARLRHAIADGHLRACASRRPTRFMISIGQGEPAMMPVRSEERSQRRERRVLQLGDEHRGHAVERRAPLVVHRLQHGQRVERVAREHHRRDPMRHAGQHAQDHAEAVVERHRDADAVRLGEPHRLADEEPVVQDVVVRERGALRRARRAAGELDVDRVVALQDRRRAPAARPGRPRAPPRARRRTPASRARARARA